jgi:hypothetical protein
MRHGASEIGREPCQSGAVAGHKRTQAPSKTTKFFTHRNIDMVNAQPLLSTAGNVEVPAYLVLRQKDYAITASGNDGWYAEKDGLRFLAESLIALLGLVTMYEVRGANWLAEDQEIDDFLAKYDN